MEDILDMKPVIRDGQYLFVDVLEENDVEVPERPDVCCIWNGNSWVVDNDLKQAERDRLEHLIVNLNLKKDKAEELGYGGLVAQLTSDISHVEEQLNPN